MRSILALLCAVACITAIGSINSNTRAEIITIAPEDLPHCDPLFLPLVVHELGNAPLFPPVELISSASTFTDLTACVGTDNPNMPNALVVITNLTTTFWRDVHYVGDAGPSGPETSLTNFDGLVTGGLAFRIDTVGVNTPLVFESIAADGIFAPGETWHFIIQDYANVLGLPAFAMGTIGVGFGSSGDPLSSGSIIALEVPGPGSIALLAIGGLFVRPRRRR
jgi:hypothetical protein